MLEHLKRAAAELEKATQYLDHSDHPCESCGLNVRANQDEWKGYVELSSAATKVTKWVEVLSQLQAKGNSRKSMTAKVRPDHQGEKHGTNRQEVRSEEGPPNGFGGSQD